jgi:hypothetical protein
LLFAFLEQLNALEVADKLHILENQLGKTHDVIVEEVETAETTKNQLNQEAQHLQSQITSLQAEKSKIDTELQNQLTQSKLTSERMEQVSQLLKALADNGIDLSNVELLRDMLNFVREAGGDPKKLVELATTVSSLNQQIETQTRKLHETQIAFTNLEGRNIRVRKRLEKAKNSLEKYHSLTSMGWTDESLAKAVKLARAMGKPEEVLCRLELLKSSKDAKAELDKVKAEGETLRQENMKTIKRITRRLGRLANEGSEFVKEKMPSILNETNVFLKNQTNTLMAQYNALASKNNIVQTSHDKLVADNADYQKWLDEKICWTTLLQTPEKLQGSTINRIFFGMLFPRLIAWSKNRSKGERQKLAQEIFKWALDINIEGRTTLIKMGEKGSRLDALKIALSFADVTSPSYGGIMIWYNSHRGQKDVEGFFEAQYHLSAFFKEGITKIGESLSRP